MSPILPFLQVPPRRLWVSPEKLRFEVRHGLKSLQPILTKYAGVQASFPCGQQLG